jgi:hypothetical protein
VSGTYLLGQSMDNEKTEETETLDKNTGDEPLDLD